MNYKALKETQLCNNINDGVFKFVYKDVKAYETC